MYNVSHKKQSIEHIEKRIATKREHGHIPERISKECVVCGKEFSVKPSLDRIKCCSAECGYKSKVQRGILKMENHPYWKGGSYVDKDGYRMIRVGTWYRKEHRVIMEGLIGRKLKRREVVHHWDENRLNNAPENLCLFRSQSAHMSLHQHANRIGVPIVELKFDQPWLTPVTA